MPVSPGTNKQTFLKLSLKCRVNKAQFQSQSPKFMASYLDGQGRMKIAFFSSLCSREKHSNIINEYPM